MLRGDLAVALGVVLLGIGLAVGAFGIRFGVGYDRIGPRFFPFLVSLGLVVVGSWLAVAALRGSRTRPAAEEPSEAAIPTNWPTNWRTNWTGLGYLSLALLLNLLLLERAGFVIASTALFWLVARAFGSRRPARDAVVAVLLSVLVYQAFTRGLGLTLPSGVIERYL